MRLWLSFPLAVALFLSFAHASRASAQVHVAVVPFEGSGAAGARRQVERALDGDSRVVAIDLARVDAAASRVGAGSEGEQGISDVAHELEARMIIQGQVTGRGRRRRIQLTARDHDGNEVGTARGPMRGQGVSRVVSQLLDQGLSRLPPPTQEEVEAPPPVRTPMGEEPDEDDGGEDEGGDDGGDDGEAPDWDMRAPLLLVQVGAVPRSREADVTLADTRHGRYNAWYWELGARAEIRPFNADPSVIRGLYGRAHFSHAVGLASKIDSTGQAVDSTFFRLDFGVGFLLPLADIFDLGVELGAGWDTYTLSDNPLLESAEYVYIRPAARGRLRILGEYVVLNAEVGVRPVLSRGDFNTYGTSGDTLGFDVGGGIGGGLGLGGGLGITWALEVAWVGYWANYANPTDPAFEARSSSDSGVRIGIWAGIGIW
jgi:hypothetical protein